ncbi:MAG: flippase-like domain-containing protein, partial [Hyphomicrobiales bacterium]|nr:flippase-like domain-containing protein [Hyphomicrobiales bacterium]
MTKPASVNAADEASMRRPRDFRRWLAFGFSLALTALALYSVFRGIDAHILDQLIAKQNRGLLAAAAVLVLLQILLGAERWRTVLAGLMREAPPLLRVQAVYYASIFFNCLPFGNLGGDVARVYLARKFALSIRQLVLSVVADRVLTVGALIVLAVLALPSIARPLAVTAWFGAAAILAI